MPLHRSFCAPLVFFLAACSGNDSGNSVDTSAGAGGMTGTASSLGGGTNSTAGTPGIGGSAAQGGTPGQGGALIGQGGGLAQGGAIGQGGATGQGGLVGAGGIQGVGGLLGQGGVMSQGGMPGQGGAGVGGVVSNGGSSCTSSCVPGVQTGDLCDPSCDTAECTRSDRICTCSGTAWVCVGTTGEGGSSGVGGLTGSGGSGEGGSGEGGSGEGGSGQGGSGEGGSGQGGSGEGGSGEGGSGQGGSGETCPMPTSFRWTSSGVLAQPAQSGWYALKDFTVTKYDGRYIVYGTVADGNWNGFFSTFTSFDEWDTAEQQFHSGHVAPTLFFFEPKNLWVLTYQWGFQYKTTTTPDVWSSWSAGRSLLSGDPTEGRGTGPIDQTVICDDANCYLFFNDDAGGVYRASMPINDFPGTFSNATRIMNESTSVIFEGVQVYSIKGSNQYLMIIENNGTRHFKAWTATDLGGTWTALQGANSEQSPFAGRANTTWPDGQWTNDISHGDLVRENPSEKMEIDFCQLQLLYQGRDPNQSVDYSQLPYRPGLLTLER